MKVASNRVCISAKSDTGKARKQNEDAFLVCQDLMHQQWHPTEEPFGLSPLGCLLAVADGVGGSKAGQVASKLTVDTIKEQFSCLSIETRPGEKLAKELVVQAIQAAHQAIINHAHDHPTYKGMGTTIVLAWILENTALLAWRGDSRGYVYRPGKGLEIITQDHSLVWDYVRTGKLTVQQADRHPLSNILLRSLGNPKISQALPDMVQIALQPGDRLLLCSDGLNAMLTSQQIEQILSQAVAISQVSRQLIAAANSKGGKDNITVALLELLE